MRWKAFTRPLLMALLLLMALPTYAQDGGQHTASETSGNNGNGNSGNNGNGSSGNSGNGSSGNGNGNSGNTGNGNSGNSGISGAASAQDGPVTFSQDDARDAARSGRIVSLGSLLPDIRERVAGEVIDAELVLVRGFLVYAVRVLGASGQVTTEYYYAQSGRFIGSER